MNDCFFQFALVHYFTKLGAGEYYLEELEETICELELKRKIILEQRHMAKLQKASEMVRTKFSRFDWNLELCYPLSGKALPRTYEGNSLLASDKI